jgi:hypothetical protein
LIAPGPEDVESGKLKVAKQPRSRSKKLATSFSLWWMASNARQKTARAASWIAIERGWSVLELDDGDTLQTSHNGVAIH